MLNTTKNALLIAGMGILLFGGCSKLDQNPTAGKIKEPIIIVDPGLGSNYLPKSNIGAVIDVKLFKFEDSKVMRMIPEGTAAFLKNPVSDIDPRIIIEDYPHDSLTHFPGYVKKEEAKVEPTTKLTPKKRFDAKVKAAKDLNPLPGEIEYDTDKANAIDLKFNFSDVNTLPEVLSFVMDPAKKMLMVKDTGNYPYVEQDVLRKMNSMIKLTTVKAYQITKDKKRSSLSFKTSNTDASGSFDFPPQFFIQTSESNDEVTDFISTPPAPTDDGGLTFKWIKSAEKDPGFMSIRVFTHNPNYDPNKLEYKYKDRIYIDCQDTGSYTLSRKDIDKLEIKKSIDADILMLRVKSTTFTVSSGASTASKEKEPKDASAADNAAGSGTTDTKLASKDAQAPAESVGVAICSIGNSGVITIKAPPADNTKK